MQLVARRGNLFLVSQALDAVATAAAASDSTTAAAASDSTAAVSHSTAVVSEVCRANDWQPPIKSIHKYPHLPLDVL